MEQVSETNPVSVAMKRLLRLSEMIADADTALLIQGETGTGKEWLARRIHAASGFSDGPFVTVHCGAIPEGLAEATLFGHEKGAFTGAVRSARGRFEMAAGGTLFLDEIGELSPALQVKLLRALQDHTFHPVGSERPMHVDVRVMAATNRDLADAVQAGHFRRDLYYRLAVVTLIVPPLREREEDIPGLVSTYVDALSHRLGRPPPRLAQGALEMLMGYEWPGNIRELINVLERGVLLSSSGTLNLRDIVLRPRSNGTNSGRTDSMDSEAPPREGPVDPSRLSLFATERAKVLATFERTYLTSLLEVTNGRIGDASTLSGIPLRTLNTMMRRHSLSKDDFRVTCPSSSDQNSQS